MSILKYVTIYRLTDCKLNSWSLLKYAWAYVLLRSFKKKNTTCAISFSRHSCIAIYMLLALIAFQFIPITIPCIFCCGGFKLKKTFWYFTFIRTSPLVSGISHFYCQVWALNRNGLLVANEYNLSCEICNASITSDCNLSSDKCYQRRLNGLTKSLWVIFT